MSWGRAEDWMARRPYVVFLVLLTLVAVPGYWRIDQKSDELKGLAECAQSYVNASNAATRPVREAAVKLDAADDRLWHAAQIIFTQQATEPDYTELKRAVIARNRLADELEQARKENPPPDPPETFCS